MGTALRLQVGESDAPVAAAVETDQAVTREWVETTLRIMREELLELYVAVTEVQQPEEEGAGGDG